jgi:sugar phosphate isomerase/epimerase
MGINFDVAHATIEGGLGGWIDSFRIVGSHLRGIAVKDFAWTRDAKGGAQAQWTPIGEGMVKLPQFFHMIAGTPFNGPIQMHYEYPLGGANDGKTTISIPKEEVYAAMKRDLDRTRAIMAQAGL